MQIINVQTELTTAITDVVLGLLSLYLVFNLFFTGRNIDLKKVRIWSWAFGLLASASFLGALAHGITMSNEMYFWIWQPINLFLGLTVALFVVGVVYDMRNYTIQKGLLLFMFVLSIFFYVITVIIPGSFLIFIIYEGAAMVFALVSYTILVIRKKIQGAIFMVFGIFLSIVAAVIQSSISVHFRLIWEFDHNGTFHIIQMFGLVFMLIGLRKELISRKECKILIHYGNNQQ